MQLYPILVKLGQQKLSIKLSVIMAKKILALKQIIQTHFNTETRDPISAAKTLLQQDNIAECLTSDVISYLFCSSERSHSEEPYVLYNKKKLNIRQCIRDAFKDGELETSSSVAVNKIVQAIMAIAPSMPRETEAFLFVEPLTEVGPMVSNDDMPPPLAKHNMIITPPNDGDDDDAVDQPCYDNFEEDELFEQVNAKKMRADNLKRPERVKLTELLIKHGFSITELLSLINLPFMNLLRMNGYEMRGGAMPNYSAESLIALDEIELADLSIPIEYATILDQSKRSQSACSSPFFNQTAASSRPNSPNSPNSHHAQDNPYPLIAGSAIFELLERYQIGLDELMRRNNTTIEEIMLQNGIPEDDFFAVAECEEQLLSLQINPSQPMYR